MNYKILRFFVVFMPLIIVIYFFSSCNNKLTTISNTLSMTTQSSFSSPSYTSSILDKDFKKYMANIYFGGGKTAEKDNNFYFVKDKLFVLKNSEKKVSWFLSYNEMIDNYTYEYLTILDNYIYYIKNDTMHSSIHPALYKSKIDHSEQKKICDYVTMYIAYKNWIYYISYDYSSIYKINLDGGQKVKIVSGKYEIEKMCIEDDWIYFSSSNGNEFIKTDGTGLKSSIFPKGFLNTGWIYYTKYDDKKRFSSLYRQNINNRKIEILVECLNATYTVFQNNLYYTNSYYDNPKPSGINLYLLNLDTKEHKIFKKNCSNKEITSINISDKYFVLTNETDTLRIQRSGKNREQIFNRSDLEWELY